MSVRGFFRYILVVILALGVNALVYYKMMDDKMYEISFELAQNGIKVEKVKIEKDKLNLSFLAKDEAFNPEDLLTVRYALSALRKINLDYEAFNIQIIDNKKIVLYEQLFNDIYSLSDETDNLKNEVIDKTLTSFKIKYALVKSNVENLGIKVYSSDDIAGKTANIKVKAEKASTEGILRCVTDIIDETNEQGGGIYRYNIEVVDNMNQPIYMISKDLMYVDDIVWKVAGV